MIAFRYKRKEKKSITFCEKLIPSVITYLFQILLGFDISSAETSPEPVSLLCHVTGPGSDATVDTLRGQKVEETVPGGHCQ